MQVSNSGISSFIQPFSNKNFQLFWFSNLFALTASSMQMVAVSWIAYNISDSPFLLGISLFTRLVPILLISLFGGIAADRVGRKNIIICAQLYNSLISFLFLFFIWSNNISIALIFLLNILAGVASAFSLPSRKAIISNLVSKSYLLSAISLTTLVQNISQSLGPVISGLFLDKIGKAPCFGIQGVFYLIASLFLISLPNFSNQTEIKKKSSIFQELKEEFIYILKSPDIFIIVISLIITGIFVIGYFQTVIPIFSKEVLDVGAKGLGVMMSSLGVGMFCGSLFLSLCGSIQKKGRWILSLILLGALSLFIMFLFSKYFLSIILLFVFGVIAASFNNLCITLLQTLVPDTMRGRVMGLYSFSYLGGGLIGHLQAGALASLFGIFSAAFLPCFVMSAFAILIMVIRPEFQHLT